MFDRRLRLNLTGFRMNYKQMQLATPVFDNTGGTVSVLLLLANAGRVRLSGFEGELTARVTDHLSVNGAVSTLSQSYQELAAGSALLIASTCSNPAAPTLATCQAQRLARAPKVQYSLGANYNVELGKGDLTLSAAYAWSASQQSSNSTANSWLLPSYGLLNLRAEYTPPGAKWSLAVFGTNVLDKYYLTTATDFRGFYGSVTGAPGRPAEVGAELKYRF
jgi:iron complex outermembrane receptor protein